MEILNETLEKYPMIQSQLIRVAQEKEKYYNLLQEELKQKYTDKDKLEELFVAKNLDEYTY